MKIKTKYNIGDNVIYDDDGLRIATITSFKISESFGKLYIDYKIQGYIKNYLTNFELNETEIISKATKKLINKQLTHQHEDIGE